MKAPSRAMHLLAGVLMGAVLVSLVPRVLDERAGSDAMRRKEPVSVRTTPGPGRRTSAGLLTLQRVLLEPPREFLSTDACAQAAPSWYFFDLSRERVDRVLREAGLDADQVREALSTADCRPAFGCRVDPSRELLVSMSAGSRAFIHRILRRHPVNAENIHVFRRVAVDEDRWSYRTGLHPRTVDLVTRLSYPAGSTVVFADLPTVCAGLSEPETLRLLATLSRMPTTLAHLRVLEGEDVEPLVRYWGRRGRSIAVRPLLQSLADSSGGGEVDIAHLLPTFPRNLLNSYPEPASPPYNCFWSAMNFFERAPDDRFIDPESTWRALQSEYVPVRSEDAALGDVYVFIDAEGGLIHAASHIAEGLVFTKNGETIWRPWVLMDWERLLERYPDTAEVRTFRRRE